MRTQIIGLWLVLAIRATLAYDYEGHYLVNRLAIGALPSDFPDFVKSDKASKRIAFLGGEADRWRNTNELPLKHVNNPDHYLDVEDLALYGIEPKSLSPFRYDFVAQTARARAANPDHFPKIDPARDLEHIRALPGFLPWAITEYYGKLESAFSYLKVFRENGTPDEIINAQENVIYIMGVMGHFVADASQPLHTTSNYNGWNGANPRGYTTNHTFHAWIDGGFLMTAGFPAVAELQPALHPAQILWQSSSGANSPVFGRVLQYVLEQHAFVEPLYELEKAGKLSASGDKQEGRKFMRERLTAGAQMLSDLWLTAWKQAPPDAYLKSQLTKRAEPEHAP
ncbi:MAG TPA: hypothetical protein VGR78_10540 [Verrucomicrobiae bacterium]|nr:hypothetical protein [Verrucomicrobiae bacterium]